jgi:hypothetical protein
MMKVPDDSVRVEALATACRDAWLKADATLKERGQDAARSLSWDRNNTFCLLEEISYATGQAFLHAIEGGRFESAVDEAVTAYSDERRALVAYRLRAGLPVEA